MSFTEKQLVEAYSGMLERLSSSTKLELIESLSRSLKKEKSAKEKKFYRSFGAFCSEKSAKQIIREIRANRKCRTKDIKF